MKKIALLAAVVLLTSPAWAKKKKEIEGLKKVIAVGAVNASMFSFQDDNPTGLTNMLQDSVKKYLDGTERYTAVVVDSAKAAGGGSTADDDFLTQMQTKLEAGQEMTPQESLKYSELMMKQQMAAMGPMLQQFGGGGGMGGAAFKPVAAQALLTFAVSTGQGGMDTGGIVGAVGGIFGSPVSGDFGTQSTKLSLTCVMQDPDTGNIIDQNVVQTKSTTFTRLAGFSTMSDSNDHDKAYDKLFKKAVEKCVKWMDQKFEKVEWEGRIFKSEGGRFLLNAGSNAGVKEGMQFTLLERAQVSGGGIEFGKEERSVGMGTALEVHDGYTVLGVSGPAKVGTIVKVQPAASPDPEGK